MTQTKLASAAESVTNVAVGYAVAMLTQVLVFPLFGFYASSAQHAGVALIFTVVLWCARMRSGGCLTGWEELTNEPGMVKRYQGRDSCFS